MRLPPVTRYLVLLGVTLGLPALLILVWLRQAATSLHQAPEAAAQVAVASAAEDDYCNPQLKQVLRRVASACGLVKGSARGCKPADVQTVAALSGGDFNALFLPLATRARILQFDSGKTELDAPARALLDETWGNQHGASFFFVVARASSDGDEEYNRQLSRDRAEQVLQHLARTFDDPDLKGEVGLMWLGEEFAQLPTDFCAWTRSRPDEPCQGVDINRSAFITWIDCAI